MLARLALETAVLMALPTIPDNASVRPLVFLLHGMGLGALVFRCQNIHGFTGQRHIVAGHRVRSLNCQYITGAQAQLPCELPTVLAALLNAVVTPVAFSDELPTLKPTPPVPEKNRYVSLFRRWFFPATLLGGGDGQGYAPPQG